MMMMRQILALLAVACLVRRNNGAPLTSDSKINVLVVYAADSEDAIRLLADAVAEGAASEGANTKTLEVSSANYKRDVHEWADAIVVGSGVFNGNPAPRMLSFLNSFDFQDHLNNMAGGAFSVGGGVNAGLESVIAGMNRGLKTFGVVVVGGTTWRNAAGTGVVLTPPDNGVSAQDMALAKDQGVRVTQVAASLKEAPGGEIPAPVVGVTKVLNSVAMSLGNARWTNETRLHCTCEAYCRGWTAAVGCGTCLPSAFSFPGGDTMCVHPGPLGTGLLCRMNQTTLEVTGQSCCGEGGPCQLPVAPAPPTPPAPPTGCPGGSLQKCIVLCPSNPPSTYHSCVTSCSTRCSSPPTPPAPQSTLWDMFSGAGESTNGATNTSGWPGACCAGGKCGNCPGGSPKADRFPLLNDTRTYVLNRRYFDYATMECKNGIQPN